MNIAGVPRISRGGCTSPWSCLGPPTRPFSSLAGPTGPTRPTRPSTACCSHPWGESAASLQLWPAALRVLGPLHRYTHHAGALLPADLFCLRDFLPQIVQVKLLVTLGQLVDNRRRASICAGLLNSTQSWYSTSCDAVITGGDSVAEQHCTRMHCWLQHAVLVAYFSDRCDIMKTCRVTGGQGHP